MTSDFRHALVLQRKLYSLAVSMKWVDAIFPVLGKFLALCEGWEGEIIVSNEAGEVLHEIKPRAQAVAANVMHLVRSPDYRFRLRSSPPFQSGGGLPSLFLSLAAQLENDTDIPRRCIEMICSFDRFTRSETDCPGLRKIVEEILGEEVNGGEIPTGEIPGAEAMEGDIMGVEAMRQ